MKTKHLLRKLITLQKNNETYSIGTDRDPDTIKLSELIDIIKDIQIEKLDKKIKYLNNFIDISDPAFPNRMNYISKCTRLEQKRAKL